MTETPNRKPQLPADITSQMDSLLIKSGELFRGGEIEKSIDLALKAWEFIPSPKENWDFYPQTMSKNMANKYAKLKDINKTKEWIKTTYKMYEDPDHEDHFVLMLEGSSLYELNLKGESYDVFERIFDIYGRKGFAGEQLEYLEFFLKERAKKEG